MVFRLNANTSGYEPNKNNFGGARIATLSRTDQSFAPRSVSGHDGGRLLRIAGRPAGSSAAAGLGRMLELASPVERIELVCRWTVSDEVRERVALARALSLSTPVFVADLVIVELCPRRRSGSPSGSRGRAARPARSEPAKTRQIWVFLVWRGRHGGRRNPETTRSVEAPFVVHLRVFSERLLVDEAESDPPRFEEVETPVLALSFDYGGVSVRPSDQRSHFIVRRPSGKGRLTTREALQ